jgi:hypothetical protein
VIHAGKLSRAPRRSNKFNAEDGDSIRSGVSGDRRKHFHFFSNGGALPGRRCAEIGSFH